MKSEKLEQIISGLEKIDSLEGRAALILANKLKGALGQIPEPEKVSVAPTKIPAKPVVEKPVSKTSPGKALDEEDDNSMKA